MGRVKNAALNGSMYSIQAPFKDAKGTVRLLLASQEVLIKNLRCVTEDLL